MKQKPVLSYTKNNYKVFSYILSIHNIIDIIKCIIQLIINKYFIIEYKNTIIRKVTCTKIKVKLEKVIITKSKEMMFIRSKDIINNYYKNKVKISKIIIIDMYCK